MKTTTIRTFKFKGYHNETSEFGEAKLTIGKIYTSKQVEEYGNGNSFKPDIHFKDDIGNFHYENLKYFEEVSIIKDVSKEQNRDFIDLSC